MPKEKILVVDDEENILELIEYNLSKEGYAVKAVSTGEDGLRSARADGPDVVILDLMLPGVDGLEVCKILKSDSKTQHIPVIMLTAKGEEADIVTGLELGADDYITKPFSPRVLLARVKAVLRRKASGPLDTTAPLKIGDISIHPGRFEVTVKGKSVELTRTEFRILNLLARRPGWVFTRYQIIDAAQGPDVAVTDRSVDVHIVSLRRKLGPAGKAIETVRGIGYRFGE
jgi:two-component system phosphate regulon response regulator PhoB